jgi:PAS domain S-box-containing protein
MKLDKTTEDLLQEIENLKKQISELEKSKKQLKTTKEALLERENYQRTIFSAIQTGIILIDAETQNIIDLNNVASKLIRASKEEIIGKNCHKYICPAEEGKCPIINLNQTVDNSERVLLDVNNNEIPIIKTVATVNLNGRETLLESFIDIRDRKKAEESMQKSEEKYRIIVEKFLKIYNEMILEINKNK